jgi:hypothetical protein
MERMMAAVGHQELSKDVRRHHTHICRESMALGYQAGWSPRRIDEP